MSNISAWKDTAASNNAAVPDGWPEGQPPSSVNNCAREMMRAIRVQWEQAQWFNFGLSPTLKGTNKIHFASSSYTVTDVYPVGSRIKVISNNNTIYGDIVKVSSSDS